MAEINVTPFVDVMLVLLIIFMVAAPLLVAGVPVQLPESSAGALEEDKQSVQLSVDPTGQVYLDEEPIPANGLAERFAAIAANAPGGTPPQIYLRADTTLSYGRVMQVMGELNRAGLNRVSLITTGPDEQQ